MPALPAQNKDLVADAQTLLEENLSEKKSVESARRLPGFRSKLTTIVRYQITKHARAKGRTNVPRNKCLSIFLTVQV